VLLVVLLTGPGKTEACSSTDRPCRRVSLEACPYDESTWLRVAWTTVQQDEAWRLTSIWENDTTVLQYPYCQNINDGRGYTSGRAGFCTGCGDAVQVVQCYDQANPGGSNTMKKYVNALMGLANGNTGPLDALGNYCADWGSSATTAATVWLALVSQHRAGPMHVLRRIDVPVATRAPRTSTVDDLEAFADARIELIDGEMVRETTSFEMVTPSCRLRSRSRAASRAADRLAPRAGDR